VAVGAAEPAKPILQRPRLPAVAFASTVLVLLGISVFSVWALNAGRNATEAVQRAGAASAASEQARFSLSHLEVVDALYYLGASDSPSRTQIQGLVKALDRSIAALPRSGGAGLGTEHTLVADEHQVAGLTQSMIAAVDRGDAVGAMNRFDRLEPVFRGMQNTLDREVQVHRSQAGASLAMSRRAEVVTTIVAAFANALCALAVWMAVRMARLRSRLDTAQQREIERLRRAALEDSLTGLGNHRAFREALARCDASDESRHVLIVDVNNLKLTNDTLGHHAGDETIQAVGEALSATARICGASAFRIGGDEFAAIADGGHPNVAADLASSLHTALAATDKRLNASVTVGYATAPASVEHDELARRADTALTAAKRHRARSVRYDPSMDTRSDVERAALESVIADPSKIVPVFQPVFDLRRGAAIGFEALSRFTHSEPLTPAQWFRLAHTHGMSEPLESVAIRAALAIPGRPAGTGLWLNVSPSLLTTAIERLGLPDDLSSIVIEVTEDELVSEGAELDEALAALRSRGARIAVDDAGAGYSGFAQLVRIHPDIIKLDQSLIRNVHRDPSKIALIEALTHFGGKTGAAVCAEGIQTTAELETLKRLNVTHGQGYLLARPQPTFGTSRLKVLPFGLGPSAPMAAAG
jgi:diguanylate cyclase (GGDEF)-like protein